MALQVITGNVGILGGTTGGVAQGGLPGFGGVAFVRKRHRSCSQHRQHTGQLLSPDSPPGTGALYFNTNVDQTLVPE